MQTAMTLVDNLGIDSAAVDTAGAPGVMGYWGPPASDFIDVEEQGWVGQIHRVNSDDKLAVMRKPLNGPTWPTSTSPTRRSSVRDRGRPANALQ